MKRYLVLNISPLGGEYQGFAFTREHNERLVQNTKQPIPVMQDFASYLPPVGTATLIWNDGRVDAQVSISRAVQPGERFGTSFGTYLHKGVPYADGYYDFIGSLSLTMLPDPRSDWQEIHELP